MKAAFKVTLRQLYSGSYEPQKFTTEGVIARDAVEASTKVKQAMEIAYPGEKLFVCDVELLGVVTV